MAESRRVRLTKQMIHDAFLELLETSPISKITVKEICSIADVNRSTFYAYYTDPEQLLYEIENRVLSELPIFEELSTKNADECFLDILEKFFEYVRQNEQLFRVLIFQTDSSEFNQKFVSSVLEKYHEKCWCESSLLSKYSYIYCVNGVIGLMKEWITSGFPIISRDFSKIVLQMVIQTTRIQEIKSFNRKSFSLTDIKIPDRT